jgi:hypothetical protein
MNEKIYCSSAGDPHWFGSGYSILGQSGSGSGSESRVLMTKNVKKTNSWEKFILFDQKMLFTYL